MVAFYLVVVIVVVVLLLIIIITALLFWDSPVVFLFIAQSVLDQCLSAAIRMKCRSSMEAIWIDIRRITHKRRNPEEEPT